MSFPFARGSRAVIGVVHLPALPGSPGYQQSRSQILDHALADTEALIAGGVSGIIVENFGDAPFFPSNVEASTIAEMAVIVRAIKQLSASAPVGVNVLRNDSFAALAIAAACGGSFIRVNVHTSAMLTDQGWIEGQAHETLRKRQAWDAGEIAIAADVGVKHAVRPEGFDIAQAAKDTAGRGHAGSIIVTGSATGSSVDTAELQKVREAIPQTPLLIGSGVDSENISELLKNADGVIVGTSLKEEGRVDAPVEVVRVRQLMDQVNK